MSLNIFVKVNMEIVENLKKKVNQKRKISRYITYMVTLFNKALTFFFKSINEQGQ